MASAPIRWISALEACTVADNTLGGMRSGSFLANIDKFDFRYFGLPQVEATMMDPTERTLIEVLTESIHDAGYWPMHQELQHWALFTAVSAADHLEHALYEIKSTRIVAHILGIHGTTLNVNTVCSSAHIASHRAATMLKKQQDTHAVVGASMLMLNPLTSVYTDQVGILSQKSKAKPFDKDADGLVRGEGCAALVLQAVFDSTQGHVARLAGSQQTLDSSALAFGVPDQLAQELAIVGALSNAGMQVPFI